jgi:hypothetical protein
MMRRVLAMSVLGLSLAWGNCVLADGLEIRLGGFVPRVNTGAGNDLFQDASVLYTPNAPDFRGLKPSDWQGGYGGVEYARSLGRNFEVGFHVDGFGRQNDTHYRDYTRPENKAINGDIEIRQTLRFVSVPVGATLRWVPGRRGQVRPYVGGGFDVVFYQYKAFGDFVSFDPNGQVLPDVPPTWDSFVSNGAAPGAHVVAGVRVPISYDFSITGEAKYLWAQQEMGGDFHLEKIDLSGFSATVGVNLRF